MGKIMKIINKILNRFGYIAISQFQFDWLVHIKNHLINIQKCEEVEFTIDSNKIGHYSVGMYCKYNNRETYIRIKEFATDNKYYNRHYAKMLLDELKKEIKI